eukprot:CAMPEP_0202897926 /NCGR_PEP_ID=MMETSP1392-20130828/6558_1 /ASSEMBLY_ACC=CAM_ASM_000868 /TAXON_ID=225041 /ORGANISM="Chlamydomonas chlamydogama, Strain SAG 11-48b" /LENGTH=132 /DNA_ID=CAMNT_0049583695 /DNA_START=174 /DNA_END=572 /DNA_ORIENTATION=+
MYKGSTKGNTLRCESSTRPAGVHASPSRNLSISTRGAIFIHFKSRVALRRITRCSQQSTSPVAEANDASSRAKPQPDGQEQKLAKEISSATVAEQAQQAKKSQRGALRTPMPLTFRKQAETPDDKLEAGIDM